MIPEDVWGLVPVDLPTDLPQWVRGFAAQAAFSEQEARSYMWAMSLLDQLDDFTLSTAITGVTGEIPTLEDVSAGFIPVAAGDELSLRAGRLRSEDVQSVEVDGVLYAFGILIGISTARSREQEMAFPLDREPRSVSASVNIPPFPVVVEYRDFVPHAPPHPMGVTSACYAKPRASKRFLGPKWCDGIVVARHILKAVGFHHGAQLTMASGQAAAVVDIDGSTTIDAAIVDATAGSGSPSNHLRLSPAVAPGTRVDIRTQQVPGFGADVLRVFDHPKYFGNMVAHRLFLDTVGAPGDSGALVSRAGQHDAAGLYLGSTGTTMPEGLVQSMRQVVHYFDIDLYD